MDSKNIVKLIVNNKLNIVIILAVAAICAIIFSSERFIEPLYKSTVILYPTTTYSTSKAILNTNALIYVDPLQIGDENQTDQMIQILNSGKIRNKIIEKYDLMNHYGIKDNVSHKHYKLDKAYDNKIRIKRTEYNSVKIIVLDANPSIAASIANDLADLYDVTMNEMQQEIASKALQIVEKEYNNAIQSIAALEDSLKDNPKSIIIKYEIEMQKANLNVLKAKYDDARINATESIPHKYVVSQAYASDKPAYPIRWMIVVITVLATLVIMTMVLAYIDYLENKNKKQDE